MRAAAKSKMGKVNMNKEKYAEIELLFAEHVSNGVVLMGTASRLAYEELRVAYCEGLYFSVILQARILFSSMLMGVSTECHWCDAERRLEELELSQEWGALAREFLAISGRYLPGVNESDLSRELVARDMELPELIKIDAYRCMEIAITFLGGAR